MVTVLQRLILNMTNCTNYNKYPKMEEDLKVIMKSDALQEASLKSIHIRMDKSEIVGEAVKNQLNTLSVDIHDVGNALKSHMEWEEKRMILEDEKKEELMKLIMPIIGFFITGIIAFTTYMFLLLHSTDQKTMMNTTRLEAVDQNINEIKTLMKGK